LRSDENDINMIQKLEVSVGKPGLTIYFTLGFNPRSTVFLKRKKARQTASKAGLLTNDQTAERKL